MSAALTQPSRRMRAAQATLTSLAWLLVASAIAACLWRPDRLAAMTLVPPWCWLFGGALTVLLLWRLGIGRMAAGLAMFWLVFVLGWVEELPSLARAAISKLPWTTTSPVHSVRIASLNCAGSERCLQDLQLARPDIVLLQETPGDESLARMTAALFGDAGQFCRAGDVAILARGIVSKNIADKERTFIAAQIQREGANPITCVSLRLAPPPSRLDFWTAAFWTEHRGLREQHRYQLAKILQSIESHRMDSLPIVIGGDFNTLPLDAALDVLHSQFSDSFRQSGHGWGGTGTNDWPIFRVDQIWTNARFVPYRTTAQKTAHSDHRLVVSECSLP
jgi:vancomycin resistance protein VanJ